MNIEYFIENWESIDKKDIYFSNYEWERISYYKCLSEDFIKEFKDKVYWPYISYYQNLSEEFIREFEDEVNWHNISKHQILSARFIDEFKNKLNWEHISRYQILSARFIDKFIDHMYYDKSFRNIYKERFYQYTNSYLYTINKRELCCLGYQWNNFGDFVKLLNVPNVAIFSEVL